MKKALSFIICFGFFLTGKALAQDILQGLNPQQINVSAVNAKQLQQIRNQWQFSGMTEIELMQFLVGKGMNQTDALELINRLNEKDPQTIDKPVKTTPPKNDTRDVAVALPLDTLVFGSSLFAGSQLNFAPPQFFATPVNYILGPGDVINLSISGNQDVHTNLKVDASGNVRLPFAGNLMVGGLTIEQAEKNILAILSRRGFESLQKGGSRLTLSVSQYRTIPVTIIGARQPGSYLVSSVATAFHLIHLAGGPGKGGTYRNIEVIRQGRVVKTIDLYDFLVKGDKSSDLVLEEHDVIHIPIHEKVVQVFGAVNRPGIFMLKGDETLMNLLEFAGGFAPEAYRKNVHVEQIGSNEILSKTIIEDEYDRFVPSNGDKFFVGKVSAERYNRVMISGGIKRPGQFGWHEGMRLSELIQQAGGPSESLLETRGVIYRAGKDHRNAYLRFVPSEILKSAADIILMDGDSVVLSDRKMLFPYGYVDVVGDVNFPNRYVLGEGMTALDAILIAGGMKITAINNSIEVVRLNPQTGKSDLATVITAESDDLLRIRADEVELRHQDVVIVKPNPEMREQKVVSIRGEVRRPGHYVMLQRDERLSSVLKRAGGLTDFADENALFILRKNVNPLLTQDFQKKSTELSTFLESDTIAQQKALFEARALNEERFGTGKQGEITIALGNINTLLRKPGSRNDLHLQHGDEIVVPERDNSVSVRGMVNNQITVSYSSNRVSSYLSEAGGLLPEGSRKDIFVVRPNGKSAMTKRFIGFRNHPKVLPGSIIVVPKKPEKDRSIDPSTAAAIASIVTSTSSLLFIILNMSK